MESDWIKYTCSQCREEVEFREDDSPTDQDIIDRCGCSPIDEEEKISISNRGKIFSEEHKMKISLSKKGKFGVGR